MSGNYSESITAAETGVGSFLEADFGGRTGVGSFFGVEYGGRKGVRVITRSRFGGRNGVWKLGRIDFGGRNGIWKLSGVDFGGCGGQESFPGDVRAGRNRVLGGRGKIDWAGYTRYPELDPALDRGEPLRAVLTRSVLRPVLCRPAPGPPQTLGRYA